MAFNQTYGTAEFRFMGTQGAEGFASSVALSVVAMNVCRIGLLLHRKWRKRR